MTKKNNNSSFSKKQFGKHLKIYVEMFQRQHCTGSITTIGWGWLCANNFSSWYLSHTPRRIYSGIIFSSHLWQIIKKNCCCNKQSWICHFLKGKKKTCADKNKTSWQSRSFEIKKTLRKSFGYWWENLELDHRGLISDLLFIRLAPLALTLTATEKWKPEQ